MPLEGCLTALTEEVRCGSDRNLTKSLDWSLKCRLKPVEGEINHVANDVWLRKYTDLWDDRGHENLIAAQIQASGLVFMGDGGWNFGRVRRTRTPNWWVREKGRDATASGHCKVVCKVRRRSVQLVNTHYDSRIPNTQAIVAAKPS